MGRIKQIKLLSLSIVFIKFLYDDFKKSITDILRGTPEVFGAILVGPHTNVVQKLKQYVSQIPSVEHRTFEIFGNDKDLIPCDEIKISSNSIYLYADKTKGKATDVCAINNENQFLTLFKAIDMPLSHVPWLDYNRAHFELIGNFYNLTLDQISSYITPLPCGSTLINIASTNHTLPHSIIEELTLNPFFFQTDNPYIRFFNYIITNPSNNVFALNVEGQTKTFISNVNSLAHFDNECLLLWQKEQIENFITFFKNNTELFFYNKEKEFYEFIETNSSNYTTLELERYKELILFNLIIQNSTEKIKDLLLNSNININAQLNDKATPIHISVSLNHIEITNLLIELKANINAIKDNQATPLILSSFNNFIEMTELLLRSGADVDASDINSNTALHLAIFKGHLQIVDQLLKFNANINIPNNKLATPIMIATVTGNIDIVKLLLSYGPSLDDSNNIYKATKPTIQAEIENYNSNPVSYILKNNHDISQSINALNNIKFFNPCNQVFNITELRELLIEGDQCTSYLDLFQPCNFFNSEEYHSLTD